ncbi:helicase-related protein [Pseudomonadales bacterium]|nr:helicase-related protein [Pseudomonadales bacterium]
MNASGGDLFIVDNSVSGWTGLRYLEQWTEISTGFDIATGYFELGSLLALDGHWQKLDKIRILMGDETTQRTQKLFLKALKTKAEKAVNANLEYEKDQNPFLDGVPAIIEGLISGRIECRVFNKSKFHAKTYITHPKLEVVGSKALVGSSNFTGPGLSKNIELNVQIQSASEVAQLQSWYEEFWGQGEDISEDLLKVITPHVTAWSPFDIYSHSLRELFRGKEATSSVWEENESLIFSKLDQYQKEAYWSLVKISNRFGGAFLCDGVGLGKTFVGLMLIERMVRDKKHVVLFAPKGAKEGVWDPKLRELLPDLFGTDFSNLAVFSHTDLQREGDYPDRFKRIAEIADVVIVDEAHHFRNQGTQGDPEAGEKRSRYYKFMDLLHQGNPNKTLFMLTATPINNRLTDLRHMIELFTGKEEAHFSRTLGIHNLRAHFNRLERDLKKSLGDVAESPGENISAVSEFLAKDEIFESLIVQRSRAYAVESQKNQYGAAASFPQRASPQVAVYSIFKTYGALLDLIERAFSRSSPLFSLSVYDPVEFYLGDPEDIDAFKRTRLRNVVTLIRTQFLKRFESSVYAFETSCDRLLKKLLAFQIKHCETPHEIKLLERWRAQNEDLLNYNQSKQRDLWDGDEEDDPELIPPELTERWEKLERDDYDVEKIIQETFLDLNELVKFLAETRKFKPENDDKLKKLVRMLKTKEFDQKKVIIFTEFADTARYLEKYLGIAGIEGLARIDGGSSGLRYDAVRRFAPYYNSTSSAGLAGEGLNEIRVLIATDVLSEGLNLQDSSRLINYDIHWNPVRLMQRIGRVDRRMDPEVEKRLIADHPEVSSDRGKVAFWNFLPPDELNRLLSLYSTVTRKTLLISETMGIEGRKLLTPEDEYDALKEFNAGYEGERSLLEDLHLELQEMLKEVPDLKDRLDTMPGAIFSGRSMPKKGTRGIFFCYKLPGWDVDIEDFSINSGPCKWYLYETASGNVLEEISDIITSVRSKPEEPRVCSVAPQTLIEIRESVKKHIKNTYLKKVEAPVGVDIQLVAWMEIN